MEREVALKESLSNALVGLEAGQRFWFWCGHQPQDEYPPILVRSFTDDPSMAKLKKDAISIPMREGAVQFLGAGHVGNDGVLSFGSPNVTRQMLEGLASWAKDNVRSMPTLSRLRGARMIELNDGRIVKIHSDETLWAKMPAVVVPGTMGHTAQVMASLGNDERAWFWMTDRGPDGAPYLICQPNAEDPEGLEFVELVRKLRKRSKDLGEVLKGVVQQTSGGLVFATEDSIDRSREVVMAVIRRWGSEHPYLGSLRTARLVRMGGDEPKAHQMYEGSYNPVEALKATAALLENYGPSSRVYFWFAEKDKDGCPALVLGDDSGEMSSMIQTLRGNDSGIRGKIVLQRDGWIEFRAKDPFEHFIPKLAAYVRPYMSGYPSLERLKGARFTQRDDEGHVVSRERDDRVWR